jgi:hypothetical protein
MNFLGLYFDVVRGGGGGGGAAAAAFDGQRPRYNNARVKLLLVHTFCCSGHYQCNRKLVVDPGEMADMSVELAASTGASWSTRSSGVKK